MAVPDPACVGRSHRETLNTLFRPDLQGELPVSGAGGTAPHHEPPIPGRETPMNMQIPWLAKQGTNRARTPGSAKGDPRPRRCEPDSPLGHNRGCKPVAHQPLLILDKYHHNTTHLR